MTVYRFPFDGPLDLVRTLAPLRRGNGDPTFRLAGRRAWRTTRTPDGPATIALEIEGQTVLAEAWGPGADRALAGIRPLLGLDDDASGFVPRHPVVVELARRFRGIRVTRSGAVFEALLPAILEQKITGEEARTAYRAIIRRFGEPAPGPTELRLRLAPPAERLARVPYHDFHPLGVERRRAEVIRRAAARASWLEACTDLPIEAAYRRLTALPGIGPWTAAEVAVRALGDADAVSVGDYHIPTLVCRTLAGEDRGTDERMLELLEPYRPHRARVIRLLEAAPLLVPRRGPRLAPRRIASI
jgi:3-methyladenine DNA glycosylase/8-oxoguanine DNA glycosylase